MSLLEFAGRGILLDIEGTVAPISFVQEVLFPYSRRHLVPFLRARWDDPAVAEAREWIARDAGFASFAAWCATDPAVAPLDRVRAEVERLITGDVKATGLKRLQGLIWEQGYGSGALRTPIFPDVPGCLATWQAAGLDLRVFSSGSVAAQRLLFAHTAAGDLRGRFRGHYDTTLGPKRDPASYAAIAADMALPPAAILFLSDLPAELDAARASGMGVALASRPGNPPTPPDLPYPQITDFRQIRLAPRKLMGGS